MSKASETAGWSCYGTWPPGWCDDDPMTNVNILDSRYEKLGSYKTLHFGAPQFRPKGWRQWVVFLWGTDIWFGKWPFLKCVVAVNMLVWVAFIGR